MAVGSKEAKYYKQCKILMRKIARKEKLIQLLKDLLRVNDTTTRDSISQQLLALNDKGLEANLSLKRQLLLACSSTSHIVKLLEINKKIVEDLKASLYDKCGTITHLEFQNKQLLLVLQQHEKTIAALKDTIKTLKKKPGICDCGFKPKRKKAKGKSLEDPPTTPESLVSSCPETSKAFPQSNLLTEGILTPPSSISSSIPVADGPSSPGIEWLDLDSRSNSPTPSLPEVFNVSHDPVPPLLTPIQSATKTLSSDYDHCSEKPGVTIPIGSTNQLKVADQNHIFWQEPLFINNNSPGIEWLDLDSRSNSPTPSLPEVFNVSHDPVPPLLTPIQSAIKKLPRDDQTLSLSSDYDHCSEKPGVTVPIGSTNQLKVADQNQLKFECGTRNSVVQGPNTLFNSSTDLVNNDQLMIMDELGPKSTPLVSIFDLPADVSEFEDEFSSNSREENLTKPYSEESFKHTSGQSLILNDLELSDSSDSELSDSSDLDTELNHHSPDAAITKTESSNPDNGDCHPIDEVPAKIELDKPEAADSGNLINTCLPDLIDCVCESNVSQDTFIKNQDHVNSRKSGNPATFTNPSHVPELCLIKTPTSVDELNTTTAELIKVVENPTSICMQKNVVSDACVINISTKGDVESTGQSMDQNTLIMECEIPPIHSPIPDTSNDDFSSADSSPVENPTSICMQKNVVSDACVIDISTKGDVESTDQSMDQNTLIMECEIPPIHSPIPDTSNDDFSSADSSPVENPTSICMQKNVVSDACVIDISTKGDVESTDQSMDQNTLIMECEIPPIHSPIPDTSNDDFSSADSSPVENPTSICMQKNVVSDACVIDISTKGDVESTDQSMDQNTLIMECEIPPIHSPIPDTSNDDFSSANSSPVKSRVLETTVSSSVMPTSSSEAGTSRSRSKMQLERNSSTRSKNDISSRSQKIEDVSDSEKSSRQTRSKSILKRTPQRITRQNAKELSNMINESPKICTRRTRLNSTPKADVGAPDRRRSSRISSSKSFSGESSPKRKPQPPKDRVEPVTHSLDSREKLVSDSSSTNLPPTGSKKPLKGKVKREICFQKQSINDTLPTSMVADESCPRTDRSVERISPDRSFKSDSCGDRAHTEKSQQPSSVDKINLYIETDGPSSELEVPDYVSSVMNKSSTSKSAESDSICTYSCSGGTSANVNGVVNTIDSPKKCINQKQSDFTMTSSETGHSVMSCDPSTACMQDSNLEEVSNVRSPDFAGFEEVNPIPQKDFSQSLMVSNADKIMRSQKPSIIDSSLDKISETANSKNFGSSKPNNGPETIHPSIPSLRDGSNILCSANAAIQSFSSPFSKSFYSGSTMFGSQNLPSFSDLKPEDSRSSSETNQFWQSGANYNLKGASYSNHRQRKMMDERLNCGTPQADVENLLIGQLCLSLNLLSMNPSPDNKNDNFFNFFTKFKKENVSAVDDYSSTFLPSRLQSISVTESHSSVGCSDRSKFTNYRDSAGKLNESFDSGSEVTIEIKQEDTPFSLKLSVPAGKPLEPVLDSLCGMVREVQSKSASFAAHRHLARSSNSESGSGIPTTNKFPESSHYPPDGGSSQKPQISDCRTFLDSSIRSQSNDRYVNTNHQFKFENKTMPSCKWANDVIKQPSFPPVVSSHFTCNSTFSASQSIKPQSESLKLHKSNVKLKTSRLRSDFPSVDDPNEGVNRLHGGIPPLPPPDIGYPDPALKLLCPVPLYPTVACDQTPSAEPSEKSGFGSSNDYSNPSESNLKSVAVEPFGSAKRNQNLKTINCAADAPVPPKEVSSKDSKAYSQRLIPFVSSGKVDALPTPLSPNLKTTSFLYESHDSSFEVVTKKRRIEHSPRKEVSKSEKLSTIPLTEDQKSEILRRQSLRKRPAVGSPKKSELCIMNPPASSRMLRSSDIRTDPKPKKSKKQQDIDLRISPKKCFAAQSIAAISIDHTLKPASATGVIDDDLKNIAEDHMKCSQCHLTTVFCSCAVERIMVEMMHFPFDAPLSPIPDSPEPVDLKSPLLRTDGEISDSGDLKNNTISLSVDEISEPPGGPVDDSKTVEICTQEDVSISTKKRGSQNEVKIERRVADNEISETGDLKNNTISLSMEEISEPSSGPVDGSKTVEISSTQEDNSIFTKKRESKNEVKIERRVTDNEINDSGDLKNNTISLSVDEISEPPGGPVDDSKTVEICTQEDVSISTKKRGSQNEVKIERRVADNEISETGDLKNNTISLSMEEISEPSSGPVDGSKTVEISSTQEDNSIFTKKRESKNEVKIERRVTDNEINDSGDLKNNTISLSVDEISEPPGGPVDDSKTVEICSTQEDNSISTKKSGSQNEFKIERRAADNEISETGDLKNNTISLSMEEIGGPVDDSKTVEICSNQEDASITTKKRGSQNEVKIERRVAGNEISETGDLKNNTISLSMEEIGEPVDDSKTVEICSNQEDASITTKKRGSQNEVKIERRVTDDEISETGDFKNNTISQSMEEIGGPRSGLVEDSKTVEMCSTREDNSIRIKKRGRRNEVNIERRRSERKKNDGITADNAFRIRDCEVVTKTPAEGNIKDCVNLSNYPELEKSDEVTFERSAIIPEGKCQLDSETGVTSEGVTDVLSNRSLQNTVKRRLRSSTSRPELARKQSNKPAAPKRITRRSRPGQPEKQCSTVRSSAVSESSVVCGQDVGLIPSDSSEKHLTIQSGCPESRICSLKPKKEVELNKILEVENQDESSDEDPVGEVSAKSTDSINQDSDLYMVTKNNQIAYQIMSSSSDIEKSVDKLLESIGTVPGSQLTQSRVEQLDLQFKPQHVGSRAVLDPLSHLGKFFEKNSSIVESNGSCVDGSGTSVVPERYPSETDDDSDSEMVIDYSSCSEYERKQNPQKRVETICGTQSEEDQEHSLGLAAEKSKATSYQSDSNMGSQTQRPNFYMAAQQGNNCDVNNVPNQSPPVSENTSLIQLPKFYTAVNEESVVASQEEPEPKKLIQISSNNKIFCKLISEEDVIPCSINMLEFASFYDLEEAETKPFKFPKPYKKYQERIENSLNEFFVHADLQDGLKKAISTLNKMQPYHVGKALCAVVGESNHKIQPYERRGIASSFTKIQKKAAVLVSALANGRLQYFNEVLNEMEEFLAPSPKSSNSTSPTAVINLSSLYALICRTQGFGLRVQSFIYDLLYGRHLSSFRIIYQILFAIPQAIPWAQDYMGPLTFTIVYLIMKQGIYQNLTPQYLAQCGVTQLRMRLSTKYGYSYSPDITRDTVMEELMSNVMVKGCDKAIILLSKSQGYKWTFSVVRKHIFPVIDEWVNGEKADDDVVVHIIRILGLVSRCFAISVCDSFVSMCLEKFRSIIQKNPSLPISEAITEALVHFKRLSPDGVITVLANWIPNDCKVTKSCVRSLKKITGDKPYSYWKQFTS